MLIVRLCMPYADDHMMEVERMSNMRHAIAVTGKVTGFDSIATCCMC